jgi:Uma2 family endonuclease
MATKTLISCEEFEKLALAEKISPWAELIDGEIVDTMSGGYLHSLVTSQVFRILDRFVHECKLGRVLTGEAGIHIKSELPRSRGADVAYLSYKRLAKGDKQIGFLRIAPELIVEVFGSHDSWEDMDEKIKDYHRTGVEMVWVAVPQTRTIKKFPRRGEPTIVHDGSDIDGGKILPGFKCPIARFFDED